MNNDEENSPLNNDKSTNTNARGYLVHLFRGNNNPDETEVLRKLCMRFSLQSWNEMHTYLPWRSHAELRSILCHVIQKQALSEYSNIRADPFQISADNAQIKFSTDGDTYRIKAGLLINQEWDRTAEQRKQIQEENTQKYDIDADDAYNVEIPAIMSIEYLQTQALKRRQGLKLYRAALLYEKARRKGKFPEDLGLKSMKFFPDANLRSGKGFYPCEFSHDIESYIDDSQ